MRRPHDLGGLPGAPVVPSEHDFALWEKRVDALLVLLNEKGLVRLQYLLLCLPAPGGAPSRAR